jgi:hypothetical protein
MSVVVNHDRLCLEGSVLARRHKRKLNSVKIAPEFHSGLFTGEEEYLIKFK